MADVTKITQISEVRPRVNEFRRFLKIFFGRPVVTFGTVILIIFFIICAFGPWIAPYDPYYQDLKSVLVGPNSHHLFGTDYLGRDTLSRLIWGARTSLLVGVVALAIAVVIGMTAGLVAGYFGGWINAVIMRILDAMLSFPMILLMLLIASLLGGGVVNIMIAIGVSMVPAYGRLMCGMVLSAKESDYIIAGRSMGSNARRLMLRHILPNCFPPLIVMITMQIGGAILAEAGLSYLGIGITPPNPAWGSMVNDGYRYLTTSPIVSFVPGLAIMLVVFAFNMVGDGLRDALDPRLRGVI